jgi:hypothetical protein
LQFSPTYKEPFADRGIVVVRKGGGIFSLKGKYCKVSILYGNQTFMTTVAGSTATPLTYLGPEAEQTPK